MSDRRDWRPIESFLGPKTGREPTLEERFRATNPGSNPDVEAFAREAMARLTITGFPGPLQSVDHGDRGDGEVTISPGSARFGPPPERRRALKETERPFRAPIDAWLKGGGWGRGREGAFSVEVVWTNARQKRQIVSRWQYEIERRGWTGLIETSFGDDEDGGQRFWWWTVDGAPKEPPPEPAR